MEIGPLLGPGPVKIRHPVDTAVLVQKRVRQQRVSAANIRVLDGVVDIGNYRDAFVGKQLDAGMEMTVGTMRIFGFDPQPTIPRLAVQGLDLVRR